MARVGSTVARTDHLRPLANGLNLLIHVGQLADLSVRQFLAEHGFKSGDSFTGF